MTATIQDAAWTGKLGEDYTSRSPQTAREMDVFWAGQYGIFRTTLNHEFVGHLDRNIRILEVGCNVGAQLLILQEMGFTRLWGVDIQEDAVKIAHAQSRGIDFVRGTVHDLPFRSGYFDMVFTSGLLIHVPPDALQNAMRQIYRCSSQYVWGFEYHADAPVEIRYREQEGLLWKRDFVRHYLDLFPQIRLLAKKLVSSASGGETDCMFLFEKGR